MPVESDTTKAKATGYRCWYNEDYNFVESAPVGILTLADFVVGSREAMDLAERHACNHFLNDLSSAGVAALASGIHAMHDAIGDEKSNLRTLAIVLPRSHPNFAIGDFFVQMATRDGMTVSSFETRQAAIAWLETTNRSDE